MRPHGRPNFQVSRSAPLLEAGPCAKPDKRPAKTINQRASAAGRRASWLQTPRSIKTRAGLGGWGEESSRTAQLDCVISHSGGGLKPKSLRKMRRRKCVLVSSRLAAPRRAASAASDFSGLFQIHKPDLEELIRRCKRSHRQGARKVQVGATERPNPGLVEFFFRRDRRHLRKRQRRLKSSKKRKLPHFNEALLFSEQHRRSGFSQS